VVIGGQVPERSGNDRTAILFQMEHRPGTLADAMNVFKRNKLNLTWIESFPVPGSDRAYLFFAEVEAHPSERRLQRAMETLGRKALRLEVLGAFPVSEKVEG
jgi:chorismate mutase/prephenate dehydratase